MKCSEIAELLSACVDGEADAAERLAVAGHLAGCASCRRELKILAAMKAAVRSIPSPALPEGLRANFLREAARREPRDRRAFRDWISERLAPRPLRYGLAGALAAAALALVARLAVYRNEDLPIDALLAAHDEYALTVPLANRDALLSELPKGLAAQGGFDEL